MHPAADQAKPLSGDGEKQDFSMVHSILKEVKKLKHFSVFLESELTDDALDCISTENEMRDVLKDVKIPAGVYIQFSKKWFDNKGLVAANNENISTESKWKIEPVIKGNRGISRTEKEHEIKSREQQEGASKTTELEKNASLHAEDKPCEKKDISSPHGMGKQATCYEVTKPPPCTDINANVHDVLTVERSIPIEKKKSNFQDENQPKAGIHDPQGKSSSKQESKLSACEKKPDDSIKMTDISEDVTKPTCSRKPFGKEVGFFQYTKGSIFMVEENREIEFKALTNETVEKLPWKIMEKARLFICGILNAAGEEGTIYFGIGDSYDKTNNFTRGEIVGLEVEGLRDEIVKAFQTTLDDHIKSDDGMMKKGGDMNCVKIYFVPVEEFGERTGRYVIEIEVKRDWKFCKDSVYYVRPWTAKRGTTLKYGLDDLYKINKEKWGDPEIRTCGKTATVKNVETDKQIKEPLLQKYKEWLLQDDASRRQFKRMSSYDAGEKVDIQKFSTDVLESLRELKYKENDYILIANKVPPEHRDTTSLAFLQSIPWLAVFDLFDPNSKNDGLHFILNETSDTARPTVKELGDFKSLKHAGDDEMSTRGTTWIFRSQSMHESDWTRNSKDCLYRALSAYSEQSPTGRIHCVFLGLSEEFLQEMADIIDSCFSIIGNNASKSITILSEKKEIGSGIVRFLKANVRKDVKPPCSIFGFPLELLKDSVKRMLGPIYFDEPGATTELPYLNGKPRPVMNKRLNSLTDLEVYVPEPKLDNSFAAIIKAKENFYKGDVIKQLNLFHHHDIERTRADELNSIIEKRLKSLSDPSEVTRHVKTISLSYESGSGATTLCRRILWDKRNTYRCAVVKTISSNTDYQIDELQKFLYETSPSFIPPVLVLVDNFPEQQVYRLVDKMSERKTKCVLLNTVPIAKLTEATCMNDVAVLGQLDNTEIKRVKHVLVEVDSKDDGRREAAAKVLEREKRFIWLGLELFGRQYIDIKPRLSKHIHDIISRNLTDKLKDAYEMILHFCCLLDIYSAGRSIYPHPCAVDILYGRGGFEKDDVNKIDKIHNKFGGLLLEDVSESDGYRGWRPAHFLVGEVVRKEMDLLATAKKLVVEMNTGSSYAKKYLTNDTVNVFLKREKKSDSTSEHSNEPDVVLYSNVEDADMFGSLEVRTRYSALIIDIMSSKQLEVHNESDVTSALDLLISLTENVTTTQHKARTWQQIARVFAYEIGMKTILKEDPLLARINRLVCPGHGSIESPANGFEVAHLVIDQAIKLQESYVHHLVTKGALFMAELRDLREEQKHRNFSQDVTEFIQRVVSTSKKGIDVYNEALKKTVPDGYLHAMVGKITIVIVLLEILKRLPFFAQHHDGPDESFKNYISFGDLPEDLRATLSQDDLEFISVRGMVVQLLNDFFQKIKLRRAWSYNTCEDQQLTNAKIRAMKLREQFYKLTGLDRLQFPLDTGYEEDIANQLLFQYDETPYGRWEKLPSAIVAKIYESLRKAIPKKTTSHDAMLMYARAALQKKVAIDELSNHVELWCQKFPRSLWANLFSYIIHFPVPNCSLKANVTIVKSSVAVCKSSIPYSKKNYRKSAAEYLLGKGVGLHSILRPNDVSTDSIDVKTKFWRSKDVFEKLERLRGQKILGRKGVLTYKGIDILFDNDRYPKESRDDLWFCLGFTISGPYAYDPMEEDGYKNLKKDLLQPSTSERDQCQLTTSSEEETRVKKTLNRYDSEAAQPRSLDKYLSKSLPPKLSTTAKARNANQKNLSCTSLSRPNESSLPVSKRFRNPNKTVGPWKDNPKLTIRRRSTEGHQETFTPKWIDNEGRVHHGAWVKRAVKSSECRTHTKDPVPETCGFAHSRKGDTLQFVCQLCTKGELTHCNKKDEHSRHIYNLGAYFNEQADQWHS